VRSLLLLALLLHIPPAVADVYAYGDMAGGLRLTDAPVVEREWRLLVRNIENGARASPELQAPCLTRLAAVRRGDEPAAVARSNRAAVELGDAIRSAADHWTLDPDLLRAVIWVESRCNPLAVSAKGARGLMQLMPETARLYGVADVFDVNRNVWAGAGYLRDLLTYFSGNLELALAAYNAGPRAVVAAGMRIPPYRETRAYVPAILKRMQDLKEM